MKLNRCYLRSCLRTTLVLLFFCTGQITLAASASLADSEKLLAEGKYFAALKQLDVLVQEQPNLTQAWLQRGITQYSVGRPRDAVESFDAALALVPAANQALKAKLEFQRGRALGMSGRDEDALASFQQAWEHSPSAEAALAVAKILKSQQKLAEASLWVDKGLQLTAADEGLLRIKEDLDQLQSQSVDQSKNLAAAENVVVTKSGLAYQELRVGEGSHPGPKDKVTVNYHGTLLDGRVFDSNRGLQPITFGLNQVIPCWTEGLQLMRVGGISRLICPADLAYGDKAVGDVIKPGSTLIFEVELLGIE